MAIKGNVPKFEKFIRTVLAVVLIPLGFFLPGYWKLLSVGAGVFFALTALVGY